jgi:hypothetical protein
MIPPFFTSSSSIGCTSTRSPSGLTLTAAIGFSFTPWFVVKPATPKLSGPSANLFFSEVRETSQRLTQTP